MNFRSITFKLILAFLFVGLIGFVLMALLISQRTKNEFDRFVLDNSQAAFAERLGQYYLVNGQSWAGVNKVFGRQGMHGFGGGPMRMVKSTLIDTNGTILLSSAPERVGRKVPPEALEQAVQLTIDDKTVGYVLFDRLMPLPREGNTPENVFMANVRRAILLSALGGIFVALILGILLARTLTRPIFELRKGTEIVAGGSLGHQVAVTTQDELGQLAHSFNQMSADLALASKQRKQMAADIAHDLRTPLSVILGYTEALSDGKLQGMPEMYHVMHKEAQHLSRLIEDLRTLSLADAGELHLTRQPVYPEELLERIATAHRAQAEKAHIAIKTHFAPNLPEVNVDPDRMAQVLGNLVSNALRYTPPQGHIVLGATGNGRTVKLTVTDNGPGIAPQDLPHIFNRFYRADPARHQNQGESGLGLAIAKSIVEAHGGSISVDSAPGRGTVFSIQLKTT